MTAASKRAGVSRDVPIGLYETLRLRERVVVAVGDVEVGVFFFGDEIRAYHNRCPHMGGPVCQGKIMPRTLESVAPDGRSLGLAFSSTERHIVCPWHGFEFDMRTGCHPFDAAVRLRPVPVRVVDGTVVLTLAAPKR